MLKIALLLVKNVFFLCEKRYKRITVLGSPRTYWVVRGRNKK